MDIAYTGYILFVVPGFTLVWTYRHFTKANKIGDFEYAAWSFLWGVVLFLSYGLVMKLTHTPFPDTPIDNIGALMGSLIGLALAIALSASFLFGFLGAIAARMKIISSIDKKLFYLLDWITKRLSS